MARMKISTGPRYEKTGSPLRKQQRRVREVADAIFTELLSGSRLETKPKRSTRGDAIAGESVHQQ